jgi:hypothetical protein
MSAPPPVLPAPAAGFATSTSTSLRHAARYPAIAIALLIAAATLLSVIAAAIAPGLGPATSPHPTLRGTPRETLAIFAHNARTLIAPLLLCAGGWHTARLTRHVADLIVGALVLANAALVGVALGRYPTLLPAYLPHMPLEDAAVAIAASAWLARRLPVPAGSSLRSLRRAAALTLIATVAAAIVETYAVPHNS